MHPQHAPVMRLARGRLPPWLPLNPCESAYSDLEPVKRCAEVDVWTTKPTSTRFEPLLAFSSTQSSFSSADLITPRSPSSWTSPGPFPRSPTESQPEGNL